MVGVAEMEAWTALMENAVLMAGAGGPLNKAALAEQSQGIDRIASPRKWIAVFAAGV